jgi:hypothetical protein
LATQDNSRNLLRKKKNGATGKRTHTLTQTDDQIIKVNYYVLEAVAVGIADAPTSR